MNGQQIFELFLDGAYHQDGKLFHPSFRKGYRTIKFSNISLASATRKLRECNAYLNQDGIIIYKPQGQ
jgi:hypothetical protein